MGENIVKSKSFSFALDVVKLYKYLCATQKEYVLSKQLLRSGTSVGAMVREAEHAESKKDFIHKMSIAQKEINESIYWLELLYRSDYIDNEKFTKLNTSAIEIIRLITSIIRTSKQNLK